MLLYWWAENTALYYAASSCGRSLDYHATSLAISSMPRINARDTPHGTAPADGIASRQGLVLIARRQWRRGGSDATVIDVGFPPSFSYQTTGEGSSTPRTILSTAQFLIPHGHPHQLKHFTCDQQTKKHNDDRNGVDTSHGCRERDDC
jgi:hypothetical protein